MVRVIRTPWTLKPAQEYVQQQTAGAEKIKIIFIPALRNLPWKPTSPRL